MSSALDPKIEHEKVKLLFDYTKFHIGLYATIATVLIGVLNITGSQNIKMIPSLLWGAVLCVGIAGLSGGVIASSLPHCSTIKSFWDVPVGPFRSKLWRGETWTYIEHTAFWVGLVAAAGSFFIPRIA